MTTCAHEWNELPVRSTGSVRVCHLCKRIQVKPAGKRWRYATETERQVLGFWAMLTMLAVLRPIAEALRFLTP